MTNLELLKIAQEKIANFEQAVREEHEMSDSVADQEILLGISALAVKRESTFCILGGRHFPIEDPLVRG